MYELGLIKAEDFPIQAEYAEAGILVWRARQIKYHVELSLDCATARGWIAVKKARFGGYAVLENDAYGEQTGAEFIIASDEDRFSFVSDGETLAININPTHFQWYAKRSGNVLYIWQDEKWIRKGVFQELAMYEGDRLPRLSYNSNVNSMVYGLQRARRRGMKIFGDENPAGENRMQAV
jgi:hypothetical protein